MPFRTGLSARVCQGLVFLVTAVACVASSFPKLSLADLVSQSEIIVTGTVMRSWTGWDAEHRFIWTHTEIQVGGLLKGKAPAVITVSEPGGSADGMTMQVPGATAFANGEHIHLFLYRTPLGYMRTTGYGQGKVTISPEGRVDAPGGLSSTEFRARVASLVAQ
jgi:hypothetical protein